VIRFHTATHNDAVQFCVFQELQLIFPEYASLPCTACRSAPTGIFAAARHAVMYKDNFLCYFFLLPQIRIWLTACSKQLFAWSAPPSGEITLRHLEKEHLSFAGEQ